MQFLERLYACNEDQFCPVAYNIYFLSVLPKCDLCIYGEKKWVQKKKHAPIIKVNPTNRPSAQKIINQ